MEEGVQVVVGGIRARLSREQMEVIRLLACGRTYRQVGTELGLSRNGVRRRLYSACDELGALNRQDLLILLAREGII